MYDPLTVAHEIRFPWGHRSGKYFYRSPFITIWHKDPELSGRGRRADDSCGWFHPPVTKAELERVDKLAAQEYRHIFEKQCAVRDGQSYAYICFEPTAYDAVYWSWRAIKFASHKRGWKYGESRNALTSAELQAIYTLSANPIDNVRTAVAGVHDAESFGKLFHIVYSAFKRHHRPWYKHPRWHVHHWQFQVHPWQTLRRWLFSRCARCGKRFSWGYSPMSGSWDSVKPKLFRGEVGVYHSDCSHPHSNEAAQHSASP